jgi:hypothetical protein
MRRGDPDARHCVHGHEQVAGEFAQRVVEHGHGLRREREAWIGITNDRADGHDPRSYIDKCLEAIADAAAGPGLASTLTGSHGLVTVKL